MKKGIAVAVCTAALLGLSAPVFAANVHVGPGHASQSSSYNNNPGNLSVVIQTSHSDYAKTVQTPNGGNVAIIIQSGKGQTATIKQ